jgi:hypothetical protein
MKIAIFLSGRITTYEKNLIPILNEFDKYNEIHLFISINGERDDYHINAEKNLQKWLKDIYYENYKVPSDFIQNTNEHTLLQMVDGKKVPYTNLSCFYNDYKAFNLALKYQINNNIKYDIFCKFRADIFFIYNKVPPFNIINNENELILYHVIPNCIVNYWGHKNTPPCLSIDFVYGNEKTMQIYTNTYNFILKNNNDRNGDYIINYEICVTDNIAGCYVLENNRHDPNIITSRIINNKNNIKIIYFDAPYDVDKQRRLYQYNNFLEISPHRK